MIQEIRVKNFLSIRDEVVVSFVASDDQFAEESQVVTMNDSAQTRLLRFGIVYGYNASGKSNILNAFEFLRQFWTEEPLHVEMGTGVVPFRLNSYSPQSISMFELVFFVDDTKYTYLLELDAKEIHREQLSYYRSTQPIMLFRREMEKGLSVVTFNAQNGDKVSAVVKEKIMVECLKNRSFFVARDKVNTSLPLIDAAKDVLQRKLMKLISPTTDLTRYAGQKVSENQNLTEHLLGSLRAADFNITDIVSKTEEHQIPEQLLATILEDNDIPQEMRDQLRHDKTMKRLRTLFSHKVENETGVETYDFDTDDESLGTLKTFGVETALYQAVERQAFLPIDEFESSLHPLLQEKILFDYLRTSARSQLLITTHNDGFLDLVDNLFRKDSIWFTQKDKAGATELYKLTDFKGVNRLASIREAYRNKRFGATMGHDK